MSSPKPAAPRSSGTAPPSALNLSPGTLQVIPRRRAGSMEEISVVPEQIIRTSLKVEGKMLPSAVRKASDSFVILPSPDAHVSAHVAAPVPTSTVDPGNLSGENNQLPHQDNAIDQYPRRPSISKLKRGSLMSASATTVHDDETSPLSTGDIYCDSLLAKLNSIKVYNKRGKINSPLSMKSRSRNTKAFTGHTSNSHVQSENSTSASSSGNEKVDMAMLDFNLEDEYTLKEKLGEGAFAKVYSAIHKETGKMVALKIASLEDKFVERATSRRIIGSADALEKRRKKARFRRLAERISILDNEIRVLKRVSDFPVKDRKSLVRMIDVTANKERIAFSMDLLSGGELFDRVLEKEKYSEKDAAIILKRIMEGVCALHENGIVHRDLKPENLVFENKEDDDKIKITDFGLALDQTRVHSHTIKATGESKEVVNDIFHRKVVGSPGYIAPEILSSKLYTPACDIWSMGCILFILLIGGPPFGGDSDEELFSSIKQGLYTFPEDCEISEDAKDLIARMLTVDPVERITAAGVLAHKWLKKATSSPLKRSLAQLRSFDTRKKLKELAVGMVWSSKSPKAKKLRELMLGTTKEDGLTGEEIINLRDILFDHADEQNLISLENFSNILVKFGAGDLPSKEIFLLFALPKSPFFAPVADICVGISTLARSWTGEDALAFCFETYDRDGHGSISTNDFQRILKVLMGEDTYMKMSRGMANMFAGIARRSPKVSFKELKNHIQRHGGDWHFKEKVAKVGSMMKKVSVISYNRAQRLSSNLSLMSFKTSMSRAMSTGDGTLGRADSIQSAALGPVTGMFPLPPASLAGGDTRESRSSKPRTRLSSMFTRTRPRRPMPSNKKLRGRVNTTATDRTIGEVAIAPDINHSAAIRTSRGSSFEGETDLFEGQSKLSQVLRSVRKTSNASEENANLRHLLDYNDEFAGPHPPGAREHLRKKIRQNIQLKPQLSSGSGRLQHLSMNSSVKHLSHDIKDEGLILNYQNNLYKEDDPVEAELDTLSADEIAAHLIIRNNPKKKSTEPRIRPESLNGTIRTAQFSPRLQPSAPKLPPRRPIGADAEANKRISLWDINVFEVDKDI